MNKSNEGASSAPQGGGVEAARVCGYTPGMGRVELQLSGDVPDWAELGETVYLTAQPRTDAAQQGWLAAVDRELVNAHLGVANADDDVETASRKLSELIDWHVAIATDPAVNGGFKLTPVTAPPSAPVGVEGLQRWSMARGSVYIDHDPEGEWVKWSDVQLAGLTTALAQQPAPSAPVGVVGVEAVLQKWLDWCNEHNEEPEARSGARIAIEALAQQPAAVDEVRIPRALADRVMTALGKFTGDEGWGAVDMETADDFSALAGQQQENGNG